MKIPGGDKMRTEYAVTPDPTTGSIVAKLPKNWKDQLRKLETVVPAIKSYDEIKKILEGDVDYGTQGAAAPAADEHKIAMDPNLAPPPVAAPSPHVAPGVHVAPVSAPVAAPAPAPVAAPVPAPVAPAAPGAQPDCFGQLYSTRSQKCIACAFKKECEHTFLHS